MNYFVPAWHDQLNDWSYSTPKIEFDDTISHLRMLQNNRQPSGILVTDYQPHLMTKLSQLAIQPDKIFAVYDYLQGIDTMETRVVDYRDLPWPPGAYFDFTNFRVWVMVDDQPYAQIIFDTQGKILWIDYLGGAHAHTRLIFDSRGFVSCQENGEVVTYFDLAGNWRFKYNRQTNKVSVNPQINNFCEKNEYDHLQDLLTEVVVKYLHNEIGKGDHLIVTLDDQSPVPFTVYTHYQPIYSISRWHQYEKVLPAIKKGKIIVDTAKRQAEVQAKASQVATVLPLFQSQFKLGHSQRLSQQRIGIFAENMTPEALLQAMEIIYPRLLKETKDEALYLFTYSPEKANMVHQVLTKFRQDHKGEFILSLKEADPGENNLEEVPPLLTIKERRLVSNMDVLTALDKIRLLIVWGEPDEFINMAAVSVGIPLLQNFSTEEVRDHDNGIICHNLADIKPGLSYYLDVLKNWNRSLVYNVKMLNRYSEDNLLKIWKTVVESKDENEHSTNRPG